MNLTGTHSPKDLRDSSKMSFRLQRMILHPESLFHPIPSDVMVVEKHPRLFVTALIGVLPSGYQ